MLLTRFRTDSKGNVALMFALAFLPIMGMVGLAVDYARAANIRTQMKAAVDATALALAHSSVNLTKAELNEKANSVFATNLPRDLTEAVDLDVNRGNDFISVDAPAHIGTIFLKAMGIDTLDVSTSGKVAWGATNVEVVMALDNTGSMEGEKLEELKTAAKELVDSLAAVANTPDSVKIGLVPFATTVRVNASDNDDEDWIRFDDVKYRDCSGHGDDRDCEWKTRTFRTDDWEGCIEDRNKPYDTNDDSPDTDKRKTLYPAVESCPSQERNLATVEPLTTNFSYLKTKIDNMEAAGNTNVTIGVAWGMSLLSNKAPFTEGVKETDTRVKKYLIVLTDGENTQNRFSSNTSEIDERTKLACKEAKKVGVVFSIRVIDGDEGLLKDCASKDQNDNPMFHDVETAGELTTVFRSIANEIAGLRIAE